METIDTEKAFGSNSSTQADAALALQPQKQLGLKSFLRAWGISLIVVFCSILWLALIAATWSRAEVEENTVKIRSGITVPVSFNLASDSEINPNAPSRVALYYLKEDGQTQLLKEFRRDEILKKESLFLPALTLGSSYRLRSSLYHCNKLKGATCHVDHRDLQIKADSPLDGLSEIEILVRS